MVKIVGDDIKEYIRGVTADNETFNWYYDIVVNLRFQQKVQLNADYIEGYAPKVREDFENDKEYDDYLKLIEEEKVWMTLRTLFAPFSTSFVTDNYYQDYVNRYLPGFEDNAWFYHVKDQLPITQIRLRNVVVNHEEHSALWNDCDYASLRKFLEEEKLRRG